MSQDKDPWSSEAATQFNGINLSFLKHNFSTIAPFVFYVISLCIPAISELGNSSKPYMGGEVLFFGFVQTVMGLGVVAIAVFELEIFYVAKGIYIAIPWLANVFFLISFIYLKEDVRKAAITCTIALVCALVFFISPKACVGMDFSLAPVRVIAGAYIWLLAICWLFFVSLRNFTSTNMES